MFVHVLQGIGCRFRLLLRLWEEIRVGQLGRRRAVQAHAHIASCCIICSTTACGTPTYAWFLSSSSPSDSAAAASHADAWWIGRPSRRCTQI